MGILLKADHRTLLNDAKYTFTNQNYPANTQVFSVANEEGAVVGQYVLLGNFGSETAEIMKINKINDPTTHTMELLGGSTFTSGSQFGHPESTRITFLPYSKVRFFWTATPPAVVPTPSIPVDSVPTFTGVTPLTGYLDVQCNDWYTITTDETHSTGYGWYIFYNPTTLYVSAPSNPIPYTGFDMGTVKETMDGFFSLLNQKDARLVTTADAFAWMNEGYSIARTELNLINSDYGASVLITLPIEAGVIEYRLPNDFGDLLSVTDQYGQPIDFIHFSDIPAYRLTPTPNYKVRYYIRWKNIGIVPTPQTSATVQIQYVSRGQRLDSYEDMLDLPDGGYYIIKDFMLARANQKLNYPQLATANLQSFRNGLNLLKLSSVKRNSNLDCFGLAYQSSV